jgi:hypothetical protein
MNGYIVAEIGGKKRGIKFGMYAVTMISRRIGKFLQEGAEVTSQVAVEILYAGLVNNCVVKEVEQDFTYENVTDWVEELWYDENGQRVIVDVINEFRQSRPIKEGQKAAASLDPDTKKKLMEMSGKQLNPSPSEKSESSQESSTDLPGESSN